VFDSHAGGHFGNQLRRAGIAAVIITGASDSPVYLWINDDEVEIRDASKLWGTNTDVTTDELIQSGVYKISRHPMYLATFLICLGAGVASASFIFILLSVILFVCLYYEARVEERYCHKIYKNLYEKYIHSVPRWVGFPR